jgi:CRP-like cAMP-binding protein
MDATLTEQLRERLSTLVPLCNLAPSYQEQILAGAELMQFRKREYVFRQGERDHYSYYLLDGAIEMYAGDQLIKKVSGGEAASFQPLAQLQPRQMSALAVSAVSVLRIDRSLLDKLLSVGERAPRAAGGAIEVAEIKTAASADWLTRMLRSDLFAKIPPSNIQTLLESLEAVEAKAGQVVIRQGDPGDYYYAIQSGRCEVVRQTSHGKREIRLAELGPGDTFGEEALVSNATRNATVRMLSDGELARLTKDIFINLISAPLLKTVTLDEARSRVANGALLLDVRFPEEYEENGIEDSINVPLNVLRARAKQLDKRRPYVVYCDTGGRSSTAAFILTELGFDACYVQGGGVSETPLLPVAPAASAAPVSADAPPTVAPAPFDGDTTIDCDVRASALAAELERANFQIEEARRMMADAQRAKEEAKQLVQRQLAERERLAAEAERARATMVEAERLKREIEQQKLAAERQAERRHREHAERLAALERETEQRLRDKEQGLEALYRKNAEELERMQLDNAEAMRKLEAERAQITLADTTSRERLEAAMRLEAELEQTAQQQAQELAEREQQLRQDLERQLREERRRLEAEFASTAEELQRARREREAAEGARQAAAEEAARIIEEFKASHARARAAEEARLQEERRKLHEEAERIRAALKQALRDKQEAELAAHESARELTALRDKHSQALSHAGAAQSELRAELERMERRASDAAQRMRAATAAAEDAISQQRENERKLESSYESHQELFQQLQRELDEWVAEQEQAQSSTDARSVAARQREAQERIRARAKSGRTDLDRHDQTLMDELAAQLRDLSASHGVSGARR